MKACGVTDQSIHHLGADTLPLKRTIHKELRKKKRILLHRALQPTNVRTVDGDDAHLLQRPLFKKASRLIPHIQIQFFDDSFHPCEVQTLAIAEILSDCGAKCDLHWPVRSMDDVDSQVTVLLDFQVRSSVRSATSFLPSPSFILTRLPVTSRGRRVRSDA